MLADTKDEKTLLLLLTYQKLLHEKKKNNNNNVKAILLKPQKVIFALRYLQDLYTIGPALGTGLRLFLFCADAFPHVLLSALMWPFLSGLALDLPREPR